MKMIKNTMMLVALALSAPISAETTPDSNTAPVAVKEIASGVCAGCHNA